MADFSIIADVSATILRLLRAHLCPELIPSPEAIQLISPADKNGDFQLGIFLYDIRELSEYRSSAPVRTQSSVRTFPPKPLNLFYMLFVNSKAQISAGAEVEQRILGRATQVLMDNAYIDVSKAHLFKDEPDEDASFTLLNMPFEEKSKVWASLSMPFQLGIYFSVSPVLLSSKREEKVVRVTGTEFRTAQVPPDETAVNRRRRI